MKTRFTILLLVVMCLLVACDNGNSATNSTTVEASPTTTPSSVTRKTPYISGTPDENIDWDNVLATIPSDEYEVYPGLHSKPLSATLYKNGEITELDINDPRLIQLLNFYHNAVYYRIHAYSQGPATEYYEEVKDASFKLELIFVQNMTDDSIETSFDKIVVIDTNVFGIRTNIPFGDYDYSVYSRNPLYYQEGISLLELFGF